MKTTFAFMKKEFLEQIRSARLLILAGLFICLGIMNPAIAKLTPLLLEYFADSFAIFALIASGTLAKWSNCIE